MIWCFSFRLWSGLETFEGIFKFHKNKIEVCKNQEPFFTPIPSEMCDPCLIQLVPSNASKHKSIIKLLSSSSHLITNGPLSDSSSTMEVAEKAQDIFEDLSRDDESTDNVQTNNTDNGQTNNADDDNGQHSKLTESM